jgi:D-amino-acid oxidase
MRVSVVGAGVVGLACARRLAEAGHAVRVLSRDAPEESTSSVAAAIWFPYRAFPVDRVVGWGARTFEVLQGFSGEPGSGVRMRDGRQLFREPVQDPWWAPAVPSLDRVTGADLPGGYTDGFRLSLPVVDMSWHLPWLARRVKGAGVRIERAAVHSASALAGGADVVVNCTGLGAREFAGDDSMTPVRGQVVVVEQWGCTEWVLDEENEERPTYIVPREDTVVLGGTAKEGAEKLEPDPATAQSIVVRCARLVPQVERARIVRHRVGLRPARPTVRLEVEDADPPVVHCYGHGGAGVTLSYGCAEEVVSLVDTLR